MNAFRILKNETTGNIELYILTEKGDLGPFNAQLAARGLNTAFIRARNNNEGIHTMFFDEPGPEVE